MGPPWSFGALAQGLMNRTSFVTTGDSFQVRIPGSSLYTRNYVYTNMCTCIHIYICTYVCVHMYVYVYMCMFMVM